MTLRTKHLALAGSAVVVAGALAGGALLLDFPAGQAPFTNKATAAEVAPPQTAVPVTVATVENRSITLWHDFSGRLEAIDRVQIRPRVSGTIRSVSFREGAVVNKGDQLFTIDPAPYQAVVRQREGELAVAQAQLNLASIEEDRASKLVAKGHISQSTLDERRTAQAEAQAKVHTAAAAVESARLELGYTKIVAPFSGRIGRIEITAGNLISAGPGSPALTTLVSVDPIFATFDVNEKLVATILAALPRAEDPQSNWHLIPIEIETLAETEAPIRGELQLVDNEIDMTSGTVQLRAVFRNSDGRLRPGQFVRIRLGEPEPAGKVLVSDRAIGTDQDKKFVYVVEADNTVSYRPVELGSATRDGRIIESGLAEGERIVVNGLQRIRSGALVDPQEGDVVAAANRPQ